MNGGIEWFVVEFYLFFRLICIDLWFQYVSIVSSLYNSDILRLPIFVKISPYVSGGLGKLSVHLFGAVT